MKPPKKWDVPDLQEEARKRVEELKKQPPIVRPEEPKPDVLPLSAKPGNKDPHARPDIKDFLPSMDEIALHPEALDFGGPRPGDIAPGGLLDESDVKEPEETSYVTLPAPTHCTAKTARGDACRRSVKAGTAFCGGHQPKP